MHGTTNLQQLKKMSLLTSKHQKTKMRKQFGNAADQKFIHYHKSHHTEVLQR